MPEAVTSFGKHQAAGNTVNTHTHNILLIAVC